MAKLVYGIGINDRSKPSKSNGRIAKEYDLWMQMMRRCYSPTYNNKHPTYIGCSVSENFKSYSYFYDWCQDQIGFGVDGFELDKDLLVKGNKIYSEEYCVFIPRALNILLTKRKALRGEYPIGVALDMDTNRFRSHISISGKVRRLGCYDDRIGAFNAYKKCKEGYIKSLAELNMNFIDRRAYDALMNYRVEITD